MSQDLEQLFGDEPVRHVQHDGTEYALLGTAHVSRRSAEVVEELVQSGHFDAIAIELCPTRYQALTERESWRNMDLFQIIRERKAGLMMASLALSAYQRRIADQFGIEPGQEMKAAIEAAHKADLPVQLIDRDLGTTMRRASRSLSLWKRWMMLNGLVMAMFSRQEIAEEDIERLKQGDMLTETFSEFSETTPELHSALIDERDQFMAARLKQENVGQSQHNVLAVLGAGHLDGTAAALQSDQDPDETVERLKTELPSSRVLRFIPWLILVLVIGGFIIGFSRSPELGWALISTWIIINGGLAALGALIAGAHPVSICTAMVAAPITSLNPTISAGMAAGAVEAGLRKPRVGDFEKLRDDVIKLSGWWRNRVSRVLLVFFLANLGSAIGTWVAGFRIAQQLL